MKFQKFIIINCANKIKKVFKMIIKILLVKIIILKLFKSMAYKIIMLK